VRTQLFSGNLSIVVPGTASCKFRRVCVSTQHTLCVADTVVVVIVSLRGGRVALQPRCQLCGNVGINCSGIEYLATGERRTHPLSSNEWPGRHR